MGAKHKVQRDFQPQAFAFNVPISLHGPWTTVAQIDYKKPWMKKISVSLLFNVIYFEVINQ